MRQHRSLARVATAAALLALTGCGTAATPAAVTSSTDPGTQQDASVPAGCAATVMKTLGRIVERVYHEGVRSQRTGSAEYEVMSSPALREATEAGDAKAARLAAEKLIHSGHLTNLRLIVHGRTLINVGGPAITPLRGTLKNARGEAIASYITSVWSDTGFQAEAGGVIEGFTALRVDGRSVGGSFPLGAATLPDAGTLTSDGIAYGYTSFPGEAFPSGPLRIYLLRALSTTGVFCQHTSQATIISVLKHVANLIYVGESGPPARKQVARVEANRPLLEAVARREDGATEAAIRALLNHHIVRLRVFGRHGELLGDVGGPDVLAPVHGTLRSHGTRIGSFVLSVQDDEGYEKLAKRLEGLDVLVYYKHQIVKNSLGPVTFAEVPAKGAFSYHGKHFEVFTVNARAFPQGPLTIRVLVPEPYLAQPLSD